MPIIREENNKKQDATIVIPYVAGLREAIKRTCNKFNIRVTFRSNTLKLTLKDSPPTKQQSNVVYQVPCDCGLVYINVDLKPNLKNRKMQPRLGYTNKSAFMEHAWQCHHRIDWNDMDKAYRENELLHYVFSNPQ